MHTLPNLTVLSLSGCSKITDDGIELIAENLRKLRSLDVSWCPRVTDAALEYIACDLNNLEELTLDRYMVVCTRSLLPSAPHTANHPLYSLVPYLLSCPLPNTRARGSVNVVHRVLT